MPLAAGSRLGPYEILSALGAGGMGEVYRARDAKLNRDVALKILPEAFTLDGDRIVRFRREAQVLASLNHPNIAAIYGFEDSGSTHALVLELVEGPTLADRIALGAVPLDEALPIARQIAEALEAAHEQGIVHRDLKPANIKVRSDGTVKVLDFGLAKAMAPAPGSSRNLSQSPTITTPAMTQAGMILGTAAYMSPEQAKGREADKRSDLWAFGTVLYEMLTGRRAFEGEDTVDVLSRVLQREPEWGALPAGVSPTLVLYLKRCLYKDSKQRLGDMHDMRLALEGAFETPAPRTTSTAPSWVPRGRVAWVALSVVVLGMVALAVPALRHLREAPSSDTRVAHLTMDLAPADVLGPTTFYNRPSRTAFTISPDGSTIVFVGEVRVPRPTRMLYRRPLSEPQAVAIPGTSDAEYPFFSPDGQWVGFAAGNKIKKVALSGGPPIELCDFPFTGRIEGASWGSAGAIVFARRGLWTVTDSGGTPKPTFEDDASTSLFSPVLLPDGRTLLFTVASLGSWEQAHVDAINVTTKQRKTLLTNAADARYSPTGHLIFMRNAALLAVPFDTVRVEVTGAPVPLLAGIMQSTNAPNPNDETGMAQLGLSASGMLVFASGDRYPTLASTLVEVNRQGSERKLAEIKGALIGLRLSSSDSRVVAFQGGDGIPTRDLWLYELPSGASARLTSTGDVSWPLFSPDGKSVTFVRAGSSPGIYSLPLNGNNAPQRVIEGRPGLVAASYSPDGKWLAYLQPVGDVQQIFVRPVRDSKLDAGEPRQFSPSTFTQLFAEFSPDSRWIAYTTNESGAIEVYVQPFPGPGEKHRITSTGGTNPAWSRNGRELFYVAPPSTRASTGSWMAVDVSTHGDFKVSAPRLLFEGPYAVTALLRSYDVTLDGQFIMSRQQPAPDQPVTKLNVVLGWADELKRRVPTK